MSKTVALEWNAFMNGRVIQKETAKKSAVVAGVLNLAVAPQIVQIQQQTQNSNEAGWDSLWPQALQIADWMCLGVIVFAGGSWMFGHRTKALELLLGGCIGYEIIRHAWDILHWLQKL